MTSYAQSIEQVYWLGSTGQTGAPDRSNRSGPTSTQTGRHRLDRCPCQVRPVRSSQSTKQKGVGAIWSILIRLGLQTGLDHFAPFSQHKQYIIQDMHHNLAMKSLKYYNKVQTHSSTYTNVLKSTYIKF
jgi:hypothetical protein